MAPVKDPLLGLELRRLQLEEQVSKLRKALRHWQTWDAEYEGLKEELGSLSDDSSREDILKSGQDFGGTFVNPEEIKSLLGPVNLNRTKTQIIGLLSRRIDYVQQNAQTVEKQLNAAEDKLNSLLVVQYPDATTDDGLPLTEIVEELDEDGEVISGTTRTPGGAETELLETLQRAGVKDLPTPNESGPGANSVDQPASRTTDVGSNDDEEGGPTTFTRSTQSTSSGKLPARDNRVDARSTSSGTTPKPTYSSSSQPRTLPHRPSTGNQALPPRGRVEELESSDEDSDDEGPEEEDYDDPGVGGLKETPEEARKRREMLQYSNGLSEVGAIVAELEIDEEGVDDEAIDLPLDPNYNFDDIDLMFSSDDSDEEDEHGRSTLRMIDNDYRQKMQALEEKLKLSGMQNLGPEPEGLSDDLTTVEPHSPANADPTVILTDGEPKNSQKKKVSFADDIDIAPSPQKSSTSKSVHPPNERFPPPIQESVIERQPQSSSSKQPPSNPSKKPSRFKSGRNATVSNQQDGTVLTSFTEGPIETHSQTVIERQATSRRPKSPDLNELDEDLHKREIAKEYYDKRNNMIQRQGGFMSNSNEEDRAIVPLPEEDGGPKKMSRFKAARLK